MCARAKYPCQVARRTLGYTKVRYCSIAKGADAHPSETIQTRVATRVSCTPASNLIELNSLVRKDIFYSTIVKHSRKRPDSYRGRCTAIPGLRGRLTVASSVFIKQMSSLWPEEWGKSYVSRETSSYHRRLEYMTPSIRAWLMHTVEKRKRLPHTARQRLSGSCAGHAGQLN